MLRGSILVLPGIPGRGKRCGEWCRCDGLQDIMACRAHRCVSPAGTGRRPSNTQSGSCGIRQCSGFGGVGDVAFAGHAQVTTTMQPYVHSSAAKGKTAAALDDLFPVDKRSS